MFLDKNERILWETYRELICSWKTLTYSDFALQIHWDDYWGKHRITFLYMPRKVDSWDEGMDLHLRMQPITDHNGGQGWRTSLSLFRESKIHRHGQKYLVNPTIGEAMKWINAQTSLGSKERDACKENLIHCLKDRGLL